MPSRIEAVDNTSEMITTNSSSSKIKGQMHYQDDLGLKWAYTRHLSNKTIHKSVLLCSSVMAY